MIISCYSPTNANDEKSLDTFYNELSSLVHSIPKYNILIIGGDINAQIGCGGLSTFCSLQELLSGFVSTNTTQILQARKQMEYDNNKY